MSQALSNLSLSLPLSSRTRSTSSVPRNFQFSNRNGNTRAMAADGRESLDHLQRTNSKQQPQQQQTELKTRTAPSVSPVGLWDAFPSARTVAQMMDTMERMMEPFSYSSTGWAPRAPSPPPVEFGRGRTPWEIREGKNEYKMRIDMPGMTKQDVKVWIEEKMLVVKAEKEEMEKAEGGENGVVEAEVEGRDDEWEAKSYGKYSGRIALPENVEFEKISAEVRDGVLYITIPKASVSTKVFDVNVE